MFYHSLRIGKNGEPFYLLKFRTFKRGLDGGLPTASMNDPRLSKIGKWIRRFKLDELATIWNLIKGDITIVGCRPDTPDEIATLSPFVRSLIYKYKPGIISPATLWNYKEDEILSAQEKPHEYYTQVIKPVKYYLNCWYIRNKSKMLDFRIFLAYVLKFIKLPYLWLNIYPKNFYGRI